MTMKTKSIAHGMVGIQYDLGLDLDLDLGIDIDIDIDPGVCLSQVE